MFLHTSRDEARAAAVDVLGASDVARRLYRARYYEDADTERSLEQSQARVRWLEMLLAEQGRYVQAEFTPQEDNIEINNFDDVLTASTRLQHIRMGDVAEGVFALDQLSAS